MKVGDFVYVPNAYDTTWKPWLTQIEEVRDGKYVCEVKSRNYNSFDAPDNVSLREFDQVFADPLSCKEFIDNYYYDGMCRGCSYYDDAGLILKCYMCQHYKRDGDKRYCRKRLVAAPEICKDFSSTMPQYEKWTWDRYDDLLRNCEFNKECKHHCDSCHKTCSYEKYMDEYVSVPVDYTYNGRKVAYQLVRRKDWVSGNKNICGIRYAPEYTKSGKIKKGTVNNIEMMN